MDLQEMDRFNDELNSRLPNDPWYQDCAKEVQQRTAAYEMICSTLTPQQQEDLDLYIAACEELEHTAVFVAYRSVGSIRNGKLSSPHIFKRIRKPHWRISAGASPRPTLYTGIKNEGACAPSFLFNLRAFQQMHRSSPQKRYRAERTGNDTHHTDQALSAATRRITSRRAPCPERDGRSRTGSSAVLRDPRCRQSRQRSCR